MSDERTIVADAGGGPAVILPGPGGRRIRDAAPAPPAPAQGPSSADHAGPAVDRNPLVGCAFRLLSLAWELRNTPYLPDPSSLHDRLNHQVKGFDRCARAYGMTDKLVLPARYFLCALIDESVLGNPEGGAGLWDERGLLMIFHNETSGGVKFFDALDRLLADPSTNLQLLELAYLCLAVGFEGRFRAQQDGQHRLQLERERVYAAIRDQRGEPEQALSPHWRGVDTHRQPLWRRLPIWVVSAMAAVILMGLFSALIFDLHLQSDPVFAELARLGKDIRMTVERPGIAGWTVDSDRRTPGEDPSTRPTSQQSETRVAAHGDTDRQFAVPNTTEPLAPTLRLLLADDIEAGRLEVIDRPLGQTVVAGGKNLFSSGRAELRPAFKNQLERIAAALNQLPGHILITGHTDSEPIRTLRFPSNQVLSQARADNVLKGLADALGSDDRFTAEGRADTEPRFPDDPKDARNRRVEITLMRDTAVARQSR